MSNDNPWFNRLDDRTLSLIANEGGIFNFRNISAIVPSGDGYMVVCEGNNILITKKVYELIHKQLFKSPASTTKK